MASSPAAVRTSSRDRKRSVRLADPSAQATKEKIVGKNIKLEDHSNDQGEASGKSVVKSEPFSLTQIPENVLEEEEVDDPGGPVPESSVPTPAASRYNPAAAAAVQVDKDDPRARLHYIKYLKEAGSGKTVKLWECGICRKEFRHQFALVKHLPTHTGKSKG